MVILLITDTVIQGGKERRMIELIKSLCVDESYKIILLNLTAGVEYDYLYSLNIEFVEVKRDRKLSLAPFWTIKELVRKHKPDVVHSWGSMASTYILPLLIGRKFKFINGFIADAPTGLTIKNKLYLRGKLTYPFSDVIISNSKAGIAAYKAPLNKSICIYNGIDINRFKNLKDKVVLRKELQLNSFQFIVGMVGAFHDRKDYGTLIKSATSIIDKGYNICFLLIGGGELKESFELALSEKYKKNILFLGKQSDVESLIQLFDIGILCTNSILHGEGISNAIIEYMSLRKPVIATEGGGTAEVVLDNSNGYLVPFGDHEKLEEKIILLLESPELAKKMGEYGYQMIQDKFLLDRMKEEYINLYKN